MLGSLMAVVKFSTSVVFSVNSMTKMTTVWLVAVATSVTVTLTTEALPGTRFLACENTRTTLQQVTLCYASTPEQSSYYIGMDWSICWILETFSIQHVHIHIYYRIQILFCRFHWIPNQALALVGVSSPTLAFVTSPLRVTSKYLHVYNTNTLGNQSKFQYFSS